MDRKNKMTIVPTNHRKQIAPQAGLERIKRIHNLKTKNQAEKLLMKHYGGFLFEAVIWWFIDGQPKLS